MRFLRSRAERRSPLPAAEPAPESVNTLVALAYELLDAHADTARLTEEDASAAAWQDHLAYLRDLQRVGRQELARAVRSGDGAPASGPRSGDGTPASDLPGRPSAPASDAGSRA